MSALVSLCDDGEEGEGGGDDRVKSGFTSTGKGGKFCPMTGATRLARFAVISDRLRIFCSRAHGVN